MPRLGYRRWIAIAFGVVLLIAMTLDALRLVRPSALSAISCTATLFRKQPDATRLVSHHRDAIVNQSRINDVPGSLVAALIEDHQRQLTPFRAFTDCFGSALGADLSLGLAQIRMSTAAELDGKWLATASAPEFRELRARLLDPESNISYEARELRALLERQNRFPGMASSTLLNSPAAMALLITEYRSGRMPTSARETRIGVNAMRTLSLMQDMVVQFDSPGNDAVRAQATIHEYLDQVRCESGIFNQACARNIRAVQARQFPPWSPPNGNP